ncbi:MAG: carboxymuconolactone decarboxylase family protein [Alphaproteobacteria bacterium]|jgi:4-carboxymuconolactone decarboxylase
MANSEWFEKGVAMRRKLYGEEAMKRSNAASYTSPIMQKFIDYAQEAVFGGLWDRPGLDLKTRTLVCVISDTVMGREDELAIHLRFALNHGWTEDELVEAILQLAGYIGLPLVRGSLLKCSEVFDQIRAEAKA